VRIPEVRTIVAKLKSLAHMICFKHDGVLGESKQAGGLAKSLRESKNPDALVLREFHRVLAENGSPARTVRTVASSFGIDASDVVQIVREAKQRQVAPGKKKVTEFKMAATPKSKRGMFKGVSQADLQKRLTAAKDRMKGHEDKGEKVPHDLRSEVSELEFALRAKHNWGKVSEQASLSQWLDIMEADTKALAEQQPQPPKSPTDMRADRDAQAAQAAAQPGAAKQAPARTVQGQQQPPAVFQAQPAPAQGQPAQGQQQPVKPGQKPMPAPVANPAAGNPAPVAGRAATPVGQSPAKAPAAPTLPGKVVQQVPSNGAGAVTLMSKPTPFPKPGAPLMGASGQQNPVAETKTTTRKPARR
jgi:hypothetical protein